MRIKAFMVMMLATSFLTLASCGKQGESSKSLAPEDPSNSENEGKTKIREIYDLYKASGGNLTYEEWLATIKGEKGDKGDIGEKGADGACLLTGDGIPSVELGKIGDSYIDTQLWDFYIKELNGWVKKGNIKGSGGEDASQSVDKQGLEFYLTDDNTYYVGKGSASLLSSITIPSKHNGLPVTGIMNSGFYDCSSLISITIPSSIVAIGDEAFESCYSLQTAIIPDGVKSIGNHAFSGCSLQTAIIPDSVISIGDCAFIACFSLESVIIPNSVVSIGNKAFSALSSNVTIKCSASSRPDGWDVDWCDHRNTVVWGYSN